MMNEDKRCLISVEGGGTRPFLPVVCGANSIMRVDPLLEPNMPLFRHVLNP